MATKSYIMHSDPAHGWLAVKRQELIDLGILAKISHYSYQRGKTVYLEEDLDFGIFLNAKKAIGESVSVKDSHTDKRSPIRSYASFSTEPVQEIDVTFSQFVKGCPVQIAIKSAPANNDPNRLRMNVVIKNQSGRTLIEDSAFNSSGVDGARSYALIKATAWLSHQAI